MKNIHVGDTILYRGCFGSGPKQTAKVVSLDVTQYPREKYGVSVQWVTGVEVQQNRVLFGLDDGHWCYADQVVQKVDA